METFLKKQTSLTEKSKLLLKKNTFHLSIMRKEAKVLRVENAKLKKRNMQLSTHNSTLTTKVAGLEETVCTLQNELDKVKNSNVELETSVQYLETLLHDDKEVLLYDDDRRSFSPSCMEVIMDLDTLNVSNHKMGDVIASILRLAGKEPNRIPSRQTVDQIIRAKSYVAQRHVASVLPKEKATTLYTDETRKFGKTFNTYIVTDKDQKPYFLGLRDMSNKSAKTCLDTFKEIISDISHSGSDNWGRMIQANLANTMSDRAATEKSFNNLLESYREEILPQVVEGWEDLSDDEQASFSKLQNSFCGLHLRYLCHLQNCQQPL